MASKTILCLLALAVTAFAAPADEALQVPATVQATGQVNVKGPSLSIPPAQTQITVQEKQEQPQQPLQQEEEQAVVDQRVQEKPAFLDPAVVQVEGGALPQEVLIGEGSSDGDKSDLDTANTFWGRRRWGGWGGGYGGWGYNRPYWGGNYYRGHGWGRGYGGWGGGYGWGGYWG